MTKIKEKSLYEKKILSSCLCKFRAVKVFV